jgi:hypothetical protein
MFPLCSLSIIIFYTLNALNLNNELGISGTSILKILSLLFILYSFYYTQYRIGLHSETFAFIAINNPLFIHKATSLGVMWGRRT